jgi:hypothetical protein
MKLIQRIAYYSGGFIIGLIILFFFLGGKKASCDYGPNARTLKNIRSKELVITPETMLNLSNHGLDSSVVADVLKNGKVLFSESNTKLDSCKIYVVEGKAADNRIKLYVENCDSKAILKSMVFDSYN